VYIACNTGQGIDWQLYERLRDSMILDELLDLIEMRDVSASWSDAYKRNRKLHDETEARRRQQGGR
jgi:hypothetical protein